MSTPTSRSRFRHYPMVPALVLGLVSLGAPWVVVDLPTGATGNAGWAAVAPASFSLALAAIAAWGATLLTRSLATRVIGAIQAALALGAGVFIARAFVEVNAVVQSVVDRASGVAGALSADDAITQWSPGWIGVSVLAVVLITVSGLWSVFFPGDPARRSDRYQRPEQAEHTDAWQVLSDGDDPTSR